MTEYSPAKTGEYPRIFPNFENCARCEKDLKDNKDNSLHLGRKYARIFVLGHYLFREANSFPRASLSENCSLLGTDNVRGQISEHIFAPNGDYCLFIPCSANMVRKGVVLGVFLLQVSSNFLYFGTFLIKQLFHSRLLDMRLVIANSYPTPAHGIIVKYEHSTRKSNYKLPCVLIWRFLSFWAFFSCPFHRRPKLTIRGIDQICMGY